jgi:50S ribosomal protein L16 3-hydroxylase
MLAHELGSYRYSDPEVPSRSCPSRILPSEVEGIRQVMLDVINQPEQFSQWFGEFISQSRHELDVAPPEPPYQPDEIYDALQQGDTLTRLGGLRVLTLGDAVYVNGEQITSQHPQVLAALAHQHELALADFGDALDDPSLLAQLAGLVNSGYWFFAD